jgi:hypothetical protein
MEKKKDKNIEATNQYLDILELIFAIGLSFFIIIAGCYIIPNLPSNLQLVFGGCTVLGPCYIMFHALDKFGVMRDKKKEST